MEWIDVTKELPPADGLYEATNDPYSTVSDACLFYDGIGFSWHNTYISAKFWRHIKPLEKRYGKVK